MCQDSLHLLFAIVMIVIDDQTTTTATTTTFAKGTRDGDVLYIAIGVVLQHLWKSCNVCKFQLYLLLLLVSM